MPDPSAPAARLPQSDSGELPLERARAIISGQVVPLHDVERVTLTEALGRITADEVLSPIDVPAHDNSAMDGYAVRGSDLRSGLGEFVQIGVGLAGAAFDGALKQGECVRIMTGAVMPADADSVVPQELVRVDPPRVTLLAPQEPGCNRRLRGEDLQAGRPALSRGERIGAAEMGLLASLGIGEVDVIRRLRVATLSTGDEICALGEPLRAGMIYDSNRYTLHGMLSRLGVEVIDLGVARDDAASLGIALRLGCAQADAIITTGGVSVGDADFTRILLQQMGEVAFWKIAIKPGRPMAFGHIGHDGRHALLFGLPGNPVAAMVTFYALVRDALIALSGAVPHAIPRLVARSDAALAKKPGRTEFQRGIVYRGAEDWRVRVTGAQGSGILRSMSEANCLIVLPHDSGPVAAGDRVEAIPFEGLG